MYLKKHNIGIVRHKYLQFTYKYIYFFCFLWFMVWYVKVYMSSSSPTDFNPAGNPKASINDRSSGVARISHISPLLSEGWQHPPWKILKKLWVSFLAIRWCLSPRLAMPPTLLTMGNVAYFGKRYREKHVFQNKSRMPITPIMLWRDLWQKMLETR